MRDDIFTAGMIARDVNLSVWHASMLIEAAARGTTSANSPSQHRARKSSGGRVAADELHHALATLQVKHAGHGVKLL